MKLTRLLLLAATAAGATYWFKGRNAPGALAAGPRLRQALDAALGGVAPAAAKVAETMWTPADPAKAAAPSARPTTGV